MKNVASLECRGIRSVRSRGRVGEATSFNKVGSMEVFFATEKLGKQLGEDRNRVKAFGPEGAKRIDLRLQQLRAARSLDDMRHLPGRCHELTGDLHGHLAVDVHQPYRLIFCPKDNPAPMKDNGGLDWTAVDNVTVTDVMDYH